MTMSRRYQITRLSSLASYNFNNMTNDEDGDNCICRLSQLFEISQQLEALADSIPSNSPLPQVLYDGDDDDYLGLS